MTPPIRIVRGSNQRRLMASFLALAATACALGSACSSTPPPLDTGGTDAGEVGVADSGGRDAAAADTGPTAEDASGGDTGAGLDATKGAEAGGGEPVDAPYGGIDVNTLPEAGSFDAVASCGILNCSAGCCASDGTCATGTADTACGYGGNACADCTAQGHACNATTFVCQ